MVAFFCTANSSSFTEEWMMVKKGKKLMHSKVGLTSKTKIEK
jgi:hypothetical protein